MIKIQKILLYGGIGILILLIGIAVGFLISNNYLNRNNKEKSYFSSSPSEAKLKITPEQIKNLTSLTPGRIIYGDVKSKEGNQITIVIPFSDPLNPKDQNNIEVKIPVDLSKDEILRYDGKASLEDIKINDYLTVKILEGKKIIYLSTIQ